MKYETTAVETTAKVATTAMVETTAMVAVGHGSDIGGGGPGGSRARGVCGRVLYSHPEGAGRGSLSLQLLSYRGNYSHHPLQLHKVRFSLAFKER